MSMRLHSVLPGQDNFFLWAMVILPFLAMFAYIADAYLYLIHHPNEYGYEGLLSTIVIVFAYLSFCVPIHSRSILTLYYLSLLLLNQIGNILYLVHFFKNQERFRLIIFIGWSLIDTITTVALIYCRVILERKPTFIVENKHLFHFISRLEVILAIFTPIFINREYTTITRDTIAFFLLFDYFSDSYERFRSYWIKSILYIFVGTVTISVGTEWCYFNTHLHLLEYLSIAAELISACLCSLLIIMQFFPTHFKSEETEIILTSDENESRTKKQLNFFVCTT